MHKIPIEDFLFTFKVPTSESLIKIHEHFMDLKSLDDKNRYDHEDDLGKIPSKKWYEILASLIEDYGYENYLQYLHIELEGVSRLQTGYNTVNRKIKADDRKGIRTGFWEHVIFTSSQKITLQAPTHYYFYSSDKSRILRGLLLSVTCVPDPTILGLIEKFAIDCPFQVASVSQAPTGLYVYDVLEVFSQIAYPISVQHIMNLKSKIKQTWAQKKFDRHIKLIAKTEKIELDKVIELGISDYGFDSSNCYTYNLGKFKFQIVYKQGLKKEATWKELGHNKVQKTIPKHLKKYNPESLKYLKSHVKEIDKQLKTQLQRIEKLYYSDNSWSINYWLKRYIYHPFIGIIAKELYWTLSNETGHIVVKINESNELINLKGELIDSLEYTTARLWHPLHKVDGKVPVPTDQIFKQSKREVYTIDFLEKVQGKVLRSDTLSQLCKSRNWTSSANHNIKLPFSGIKVKLILEDILDGTRTLGNTSANRIFKGILIKKKKTVITPSQIDPIILSEILRDVDLFVTKSNLVNV